LTNSVNDHPIYKAALAFRNKLEAAWSRDGQIALYENPSKKLIDSVHADFKEAEQLWDLLKAAIKAREDYT
jgi:hypothetical protein